MEFSVDYKKIKESYKDFRPRFEFHRQSINYIFKHYLKKADLVEVSDFMKNEATDEVMSEFKQKLIYHSTLCFFRSFDLFLSLITLDKGAFYTWSQVTGYYSKFYIIKALCFLLQRGYVELKPDDAGEIINARDNRSFYFFHLDNGFQMFNRKSQEYKYLQDKGKGSHQIWWTLLETFPSIKGLEDFSRFNFLMDKYWVNPKIRNEINYSLEYLEGFNELEWFDSDLKSHHRLLSWSGYRNFCTIENYYENTPPEDIDVGDYYTDIKVILWETILCYLDIYKDLIGVNSIFNLDNVFELLKIHNIKGINNNKNECMKEVITKIFNDISIEEDELPFL